MPIVILCLLLSCFSGRNLPVDRTASQRTTTHSLMEKLTIQNLQCEIDI